MPKSKNKRRKKNNGLAAVLAAGYGRNDLGHNRTGYLETLRTFNQLTVHHCAIVQHILNIDQTAIEDWLYKVVRIMEMNHTFFMSFGNFFRQKQTTGQVLGHLAGNQIPLCGSHRRIFIGVFLHNIFVAIFDQA